MRLEIGRLNQNRKVYRDFLGKNLKRLFCLTGIAEMLCRLKRQSRNRVRYLSPGRFRPGPPRFYKPPSGGFFISD